MNNKGFMMAEVVVVSSIIIVTLVGLYTSYNKILSLYNQRINYYDINTLYELGNIRKNTNLSTYKSKDYIVDETYKKVYYLNHNDIIDLTGVTNETFKDYLIYLKDSTKFETEYILIMENCIDDDKCKYAYLEVYE